MDFAQLRSNIFEGEEEVVTSTPIRDQLRDSMVGFPLLLGMGSLTLWGFDKWFQNGELLSVDGEYNYRPLVFSLMGLFPLGFGLGGLFRGLQAASDEEKYEQVIEVAKPKWTVWNPKPWKPKNKHPLKKCKKNLGQKVMEE